jgi:NADH-quinone oxidoreductase subunit M
MNHSLTILTLVPLLGGIVVAGLGSERQKLARGLALGFSLIALTGAFCLWTHFQHDEAGLQFVEQFTWVKSLGIDYYLGIDGLGLLMVMLTALVVPLAIMGSWSMADRPNVYHALILWLQAGLFGTFTALNFFHWFMFWELGLIPAYFLVKLWGGPKRSSAATQFFIYTMVGSVALLLSFLAIWLATRTATEPGCFDFIKLAGMGKSGALTRALEATAFGWKGISLFIFFGVFLGFAVKVPLVPFHTWLPATYSEAPSAVTMLLTGVMSKMGVYGFLRILLPIFPDQIRQVLTPLLWLAVATIVLSACAAFAQRDLKRMLAYSSVNHLGYCLLAMFAAVGGVNATLGQKSAALDGVLLQMFNHGLTASALFLFVALLEKRSGGLRGLDDFGGLRKVVPVFTGLMGIAIFSSLGLPGLNGFVGEFLIFFGVFALAPWTAVLSTIGLLVTAIFLLTFIQRVFCGPLNERWAKFPDLTTAERWLVLPSIVLMFVLGIYPQLILGVIDTTVMNLVKQL